MSYGIYVGKNLTADGSVFLAGYGDEPSSHWLEIIPEREHPEGATIKVGATETAKFPGEQIEIPQVGKTAAYITMNYSSYAGYVAPITNGGLNAHEMAARDIWSPSREELKEMTPNPQRGPHYSDLSRIVMERARSARESVEIVGGLIDEYGYSTYGGNSHMFADREEGWILIDFAGGAGLWVAERLGPDDIRVSRPGYIGEIPLDFQNSSDFMGSSNLISFAEKHGWFDRELGEPFNVNKIYGDGRMRLDAVEIVEGRLSDLKGRIGLVDVMAEVRADEVMKDSAGYGQVAHLQEEANSELTTLWVAATTPVAAPFIPYRIGVTEAPPEFGKHRYLTEGENYRFVDQEFQGIESTHYACRLGKRLYYLMMEHREAFYEEVVETYRGFERGLIAREDSVKRTAAILYESGQTELAREYLTYYSLTEAMNGLRLMEALAVGIEARTKALFGIRKPKRASTEA
jgi:dipeptidase